MSAAVPLAYGRVLVEVFKLKNGTQAPRLHELTASLRMVPSQRAQDFF